MSHEGKNNIGTKTQSRTIKYSFNKILSDKNMKQYFNNVITRITFSGCKLLQLYLLNLLDRDQLPNIDLTFIRRSFQAVTCTEESIFPSLTSDSSNK